MKEFYYSSPQSLWDLEDSTKSHLKIYGIINCLDRKAIYKVSKLVEWSGLTKQTVYRCLKDLVRWEFLYKSDNAYTLHSPQILDIQSNLAVTTPKKSNLAVTKSNPDVTKSNLAVTKKSHVGDSALYIDNTKDNTKDKKAAPSHSLPNIDLEDLGLSDDAKKYLDIPNKQNPQAWLTTPDGLAGRVPFKKFPTIFINPNRFDQLIDHWEDNGIKTPKQRGKVLLTVESKIEHYVSGGRPRHKIDALDYLMNFCMQKVISTEISSNSLAKSQGGRR